MVKYIKKRYLFTFLLIIVVFTSFLIQAEAFSLNPLPFIEKTANIIATRVSDIITYMVLQGKYIFSNYTDPNIYSSIDIPASIEHSLISSSSSININDNISKTPIVVGTTTLPKVNIALPTPVLSNSKPQVISVPGFVKDSIALSPEVTLANYDSNQILKFSNAERQSASLPPLAANSILDSIAALRADDLFANQYFEHDSPDGKSATDLAKKIGFEYILIGENLALGSFDGNQGIVAAWMASPGHRANILNNKYTDLGVAVKTGMYKGDNTLIAVQIFAVPKNHCPNPNQEIKSLIDSSGAAIKQMQAEASVIYNNLITIRNNPVIDRSYYNQKIQEYNYLARKVNDAVTGLKIIIDSYNIDVAKYNSCIKSII